MSAKKSAYPVLNLTAIRNTTGPEGYPVAAGTVIAQVKVPNAQHAAFLVSNLRWSAFRFVTAEGVTLHNATDCTTHLPAEGAPPNPPAELVSLTGLGAELALALAQRGVTNRHRLAVLLATDNGAAEIEAVPGIGPDLIASLREQLGIDAPEPAATDEPEAAATDEPTPDDD